MNEEAEVTALAVHEESDEDEALSEAAQGYAVDSDDEIVNEAEVESEIDAAGAAAGLVSRDEKPFRGVEEVDRRDDRRWELDPRSRDDGL
jgi:hypothetical protein